MCMVPKRECITGKLQSKLEIKVDFRRILIRLGPGGWRKNQASRQIKTLQLLII